MQPSFTSPRKIRKSVIGSQHTLQGPFGATPIVDADCTASSKALSFIEEYILECVLPFYANTHTSASATGLQTTRFREDARTAIRVALNAPHDEYAVIFTGSGATGAMNKLANVLGISPLMPLVDDPSQRSVVFISSQEHHSNELLWREAGNVDCVVIPQDMSTGLMDLSALEKALYLYKSRPFKLASFSAASNVTGIRCNTHTVTNILHNHGVVAAWDFAAAGPHVGINMQGEDIDAVYLSPHKFVGGPGTPGLLVARRSLFTNTVPTVPGGGTVRYVQPHGHQYISLKEDIESREEGGTPAIVESIRCGLALQLHNKVGPDWIEKQEGYYLNRAFKAWKTNPNIVLLGNQTVKRVSIMSFLIKSPGINTKRNAKNYSATFLHHNFVVSLLNDLFGIQSRGGCSCAGPYGHLVLNIDQAQSDKIIHKMETLGEAIKPGWTRLSFSYYMSQETVDYIIAAVNLIALEGYKLLPQYAVNPRTGSWTHIEHKSRAMTLWNFSSGPYSKPPTVSKKDLKRCLRKAKQILRSCQVPQIEPVSEAFLLARNVPALFLPSLRNDKEDRDVMWFVVAKEEQQRPTKGPFSKISTSAPDLAEPASSSSTSTSASTVPKEPNKKTLCRMVHHGSVWRSGSVGSGGSA